MTPTEDINPLNAGHYDTVMQGLYVLNNATQQIAMAKAAGVDVRHHEQLASHLQGQLESIRNTYFPAGRPKG